MEYLEFINNSLKRAADIARDHFGKVGSSEKSGDNNQVLTEADLKIGTFLIEQIKKTYPEHNIIDEEAGVINNGSPFTWVIDPIDGTSNFANGSPLYGTMLGLLEKDTSVAGGVSLPYFDEISCAEKGKGAFSNGSKIFVTKENNLLKSLIAYGIDGHQENIEFTRNEAKLLGEIVLKIRNLRMSNSAFDIVMVAKGVYGACLNRTSKIWDNVAQEIIIEEAGGVYTDFFGVPINYSNHLEKPLINYTFCAASPELHKQLQEIITL